MQIQFKVRIPSDEGFKTIGGLMSVSKADALKEAKRRFSDHEKVLSVQGDNKMPARFRG